MTALYTDGRSVTEAALGLHQLRPCSVSSSGPQAGLLSGRSFSKPQGGVGWGGVFGDILTLPLLASRKRVSDAKKEGGGRESPCRVRSGLCGKPFIFPLKHSLLPLQCTQLKEMCRRELDKAESEIKKNSSIIGDYKQVGPCTRGLGCVPSSPKSFRL